MKAAGIAAIILIVGVVGTMDAQDADVQDVYYEEMVCGGHWPDYQEVQPTCD